MAEENGSKYLSRSKAQEYARMSYLPFSLEVRSEPFYSRVGQLIEMAGSFMNSPQPHTLHGIDVAFGAGRSLIEMRKAYPDAYLTGIEYSQAMLDITDNIVRGTEPVTVSDDAKITGMGMADIQLILGDIQRLDELPMVKGDIVVCINVLDRVPNTSLAIQQMINVTEAGGVLVVVSAFDYEDDITPPQEQLDIKTFERTFRSLDTKIVHQESLTLKKQINPQNGQKTYQEQAYIFTK